MVEFPTASDTQLAVRTIYPAVVAACAATLRRPASVQARLLGTTALAPYGRAV